MQALKRFLKVQQHFDDFQEDQFDFHGYCIRKMVHTLAPLAAGSMPSVLLGWPAGLPP
jgi:hypothetical protein